jgi:hypothetical protein
MKTEFLGFALTDEEAAEWRRLLAKTPAGQVSPEMEAFYRRVMQAHGDAPKPDASRDDRAFDDSK